MIAGAQLSGSHDHSSKTIESVAVTYAYGVTNDLTVSVRLPSIGRTGIREAEIEAVLLGVKAPTGVTDRRNNQGELFDAEFQPGSESWDGLFGLAYTNRFGQWSFDANWSSFVSVGFPIVNDLNDIPVRARHPCRDRPLRYFLADDVKGVVLALLAATFAAGTVAA